MAKHDIEGLVLLLDVGLSMSTKIGNTTTTYLQSCVDIIQMIVQRKMFQTSKDELALVLFGTRETANELWDGNSDHYSHVTVARPLSIVDWKMLEFIQNDISCSNQEGDLLDGIVVASNHFHEDQNKKKIFKEKRIIVLTDFSSSAEEDDKLNVICNGLSKHSIRIDVISPFSEEDLDDNDQDEIDYKNNENLAITSKNDQKKERKRMTKSQKEAFDILKQICEKTDGAIFSFDEALSILSTYQSKAIKSTGTKYQMTIGEKFKLPIVSMIKCKESKPELFRFKKVYAKDESVELKTDRARFTKDDEQRDLDDKTDVVDAYKYGSTFVPIDNDSSTLRLQVEKCFSVLGFTKSENVPRHYYIGDAVHQIVPDPSAGDDCEEAFVNMVRAMYAEDVYAIVRKVYSSRSSPELGCLIPYITTEMTCLFFITIPFEDDIRKFTLENFNYSKKYKPSEQQLTLIDDLIDSMDLTKKINDKNEDDDGEEPYDPHLTFNPYIQRMFQSIAVRATNPDGDLPDFETHFTNTHLAKIGMKIRNEKTLDLLKRCTEAFPTKAEIKKQKKDEENIFAKIKESEKDENGDLLKEMDNKEENLGLDEILQTNLNHSKITRVGTANPTEDFRILAEKITSSADLEEEYDDLCTQIQILIKDLFAESLQHILNNEDDLIDSTVYSFQEKSFNCIKIHREYSIRFKLYQKFNLFLKTFKIYLLNESKKLKYKKHIQNYWRNFFHELNVSLIDSSECYLSDVSVEQAREFIINFIEKSDENIKEESKDDSKENVEDLLDLM